GGPGRPAATPLGGAGRVGAGARSRRAAKLLAAAGHEVHDLTGGMRAWASAGLAVRAKGGRPGHIA
ncbi:hypothetical protein ACWEOR_25570, partial [Micromonospora chalcea]